MDTHMKQILDMQNQGIAEGQIIKMFGGTKSFNRIIKRNNYKRDDTTGKYIPKVTKAKPIQELPKEEVLQVVNPCYNEPQQVKMVVQEQQVEPMQRFSESDLDILVKIIAEYKVKDNIRGGNQQEYQGTIKNRNIRLYEEHYNEFAKWCKENNLTQANALRMAIDMFMDSFK